MNVGLPGTGIGGLFYLLSAFTMPFTEAVRTIRGEKPASRWRFVMSQVGIAISIFAVLAATWAVLDRLISATTRLLSVVSPEIAQRIHVPDIGIAPTLLTVATLVIVLISIEVLSLALRFMPAKRRGSRSDSSRGVSGPAWQNADPSRSRAS